MKLRTAFVAALAVAGAVAATGCGHVMMMAHGMSGNDRAPKAPEGHSELEPLRLSAHERRQIEAFLRSVSGGARE